MIPRTAERCVDALAEAGALITAKEWSRAAIVAALVGPARGKGYRSQEVSSDLLTVDDLTAKGIVGLSTHNTVERYRDAWHTVRPTPTLGERVDLDGLPDWPPNSKTADTAPGAQKIRDVKSNASAVAKAMEDPAFANRVVERSTPQARDSMRVAVSADDAEYARGLRRSAKANEAADAARPVWLGEILDVAIQMERAGERARRLMRGDPAANRWNDESIALLNTEVDKAQAILDWLRTLPEIDSITPESIIGNDR
jgi:hypothetical protein